MIEEFNRWHEVAEEIDQQVNKLVRKTAFDAERIAKPLARWDTGFMRNALYVRLEDGGDFHSLSTPPGYVEFPEIAAPPHNEALLVGGAGHTIYNEFGTSHMAAKPMIVPAIEAIRQPFLEALKQLADGEGVK